MLNFPPTTTQVRQLMREKEATLRLTLTEFSTTNVEDSPLKTLDPLIDKGFSDLLQLSSRHKYM